MSNQTLESKNNELFKLLLPHRGTPAFMQRINLFVKGKTGKSLPDYINNGAAVEEKIALIDGLITLVKAGEWDKLPAAPNGQATDTPAKVIAPPPPPASPAPVEVPPPPPPPPPVVVTPSTPAAPAPVVAAAADEDQDAADQIAGLIRQLATKDKSKPLTEADVRRIVRQELAHVFNTTASILSK